MENLIFGISTVLICAVLYYFAFRLFRKQKTKYCLILLIGCGLLLRLYTATESYLHPWDERFHALVSKNLIEHPFKPTLYEDPVLSYDYRIWYSNHVWLHKQPLPLWTMAISMYLFGVNEIALRLPSVILSTIGIWVVFSIGRELFNQKIGFLAAFLYSIHGLIIEITSGRVATDHIDVFFLFFIQFAVLMAIKFGSTKRTIYNLLCGLSIGAAILSKWLPALIVLPIWLLIISASKKFTKSEIVINLVLLLSITIAVFLPWQIYIHKVFPLEARWENSYNIRHITEVVEGHGGPLYYHFNNMRIQFGELIYLPLLWFLWKSVKKRNNFIRLSLTIWILIPYLFFSFVKTKMQGYTIFAAPAIFIITSYFWYFIFRFRHRFRYKWVTFIVLFFLVALPIRYSIERIKPFEFRERNPQWVQQIKNLKSFNGNVVIFNIEHPIEVMFYTNTIAYSNIPDINTIKGIVESGYEVIINDNGKLNIDFNTLEKVRVICLISQNE